MSEPKKVKIKHVSKGENLFETPEDEVLDRLPSYFQDRSSVLIEPTQVVNLGAYEALTNGLKMAIEWRITELHIYGDSQLIINQVNDNYLTKNEKLVPYKKMVDSLRLYFTFVSFQQIPQEENKAANAMATLASLLHLE